MMCRSAESAIGIRSFLLCSCLALRTQAKTTGFTPVCSVFKLLLTCICISGHSAKVDRVKSNLYDFGECTQTLLCVTQTQTTQIKCYMWMPTLSRLGRTSRKGVKGVNESNGYGDTDIIQAQYPPNMPPLWFGFEVHILISYFKVDIKYTGHTEVYQQFRTCHAITLQSKALEFLSLFFSEPKSAAGKI
ncbi:hypothetical protein VTI28DRAFT_8309 [Corynascus sepedonium]